MLNEAKLNSLKSATVNDQFHGILGGKMVKIVKNLGYKKSTNSALRYVKGIGTIHFVYIYIYIY